VSGIVRAPITILVVPHGVVCVIVAVVTLLGTGHILVLNGVLGRVLRRVRGGLLSRVLGRVRGGLIGMALGLGGALPTARHCAKTTLVYC